MSEKETMIDWTGETDRGCITPEQYLGMKKAFKKQDEMNRLSNGRLPTKEEFDNFTREELEEQIKEERDK